MDTAKVFWSGRSQAIRLPKAFRLDVSQVRISRVGTALVLEPVAENWAWLDAVRDKVGAGLDGDFIEFAEENSAPQERAELLTLFN